MFVFPVSLPSSSRWLIYIYRGGCQGIRLFLMVVIIVINIIFGLYVGHYGRDGLRRRAICNDGVQHRVIVIDANFNKARLFLFFVFFYGISNKACGGGLNLMASEGGRA